MAKYLAQFTDSYYNNVTPFEAGKDWIGDVGLHFQLSSSPGSKGRILSTVVRFMQSERCLEFGTAYGMSASFILETLRFRGNNGHLTTLEGSEFLYSLSSRLLKARYGSQVSCIRGWTQEALPEIVKSLVDIDFLFHDAGHSKEDYINDFNTVLPVLNSGAVVLIDDIRWEDPRFYSGNPRCYEGWMELVNHPRVCQAIEIEDSLGILLLS